MIEILTRGPYPLAFLEALAFLIAIMIGISVHEFAHAFSSYKCGDYTAKSYGRMTLNPIKHFDPFGFLMLAVAGFGWAKPVPINPGNFTKPLKRSMFWVSMSGIITNFGLAFLLYPLFLVVVLYIPQSFLLWDFLYYFTMYLFSINLTLAVFNLLPIYPLDGFEIVELYSKTENAYLRFMRRYGHYVLLGVLLMGAIPFLSSFSPISFLVSKIGWPIQWFWGLIF